MGRPRSKPIVPSFDNEQHALIFERYVIGVGMTPRMVTNLETGENYRDGETAARKLGVSRQAVNNCVRGRQATVKGCHLVLATEFRKAMLKELTDICAEHGTDPQDVMDELRTMKGKRPFSFGRRLV